MSKGFFSTTKPKGLLKLAKSTMWKDGFFPHFQVSQYDLKDSQDGGASVETLL